MANDPTNYGDRGYGERGITGDRATTGEGRGAMDRMASKMTGDRGTNEYRRVLSASSITGDRVVNRAGEDLGKIHELMVDVESGRVAYAVLSFGGFLGMGDKLFAIPWNRLTVDEANKQLLLDVDRETLERAPGFDKDNWPDMSDTNWGSDIYNYYGSEPYWGTSQSTDAQRGLGLGPQSGTTRGGSTMGTGSTTGIVDPDRPDRKY
jgi:sporulation protein YlmC with PRC-barrel domain